MLFIQAMIMRGWLSWEGRGRVRLGPILTVVAYALVVFGLLHNLSVSWRLYSRVPLSDTGQYADAARESRRFYDSGFREPVPVFMVKVYQSAGLSDESSVRVSSVVMGLVALAFLLFLAASRFGTLAALVAGVLYAVNPFVGFYGVSGSNNIMSGVFLMALFFLITGERLPLGRAALAGFLGALAALTRLEGLAIVPLMLVAAVGLHFSRERLKGSFLAGVVFVAFCAPYLMHQYARYGHPFHSHTVHARFWRNTAQGRLADRYAETGPDAVSPLSRGVGPVESLRRMSVGYRKAFSHYLPRLIHYRIGLIFFLLGMVFLLLGKDYFTVLCLPIILLPVSFILPLDQAYPGSGVEMRFVTNLLWLVCLIAGIGAKDVVALLLAKKRNKKPQAVT